MCCFPLMLRNGHKEQDLMLCQDVGSADTYWLPTQQETSLESEKAWMKGTLIFFLEVFSLSPGCIYKYI